MKRTLKLLALTVVGLILVGFLGFVGINSTHANLNPAAAALIRKFHDHPDPPGNAYYALVGLQLPGKAAPPIKGRSFIAKVSAMRPARQIAYATKTFEPLVSLPNVTDCTPRKQNCLVMYRANKTKIRAATANYRSLLDGYSNTVRKYRVFYATGHILAWHFGLLSAHQLYVLRTFNLWNAGQRRQALHKLSGEVFFWRMMLRDAHLGVTRFIAAAILTDDYGLAGEFLRACPTCRKISFASTLFAPLTARELDPTKAAEGEFVRNVVLMREADAERRLTQSFWQRLTYHPNQIVNALYAELQDEIRLAKAPPGRRAQLTKALNAKYALGSSLISWIGLYVHPHGKIMASITWASRNGKYGYPVRLADRYRARIATKYFGSN